MQDNVLLIVVGLRKTYGGILALNDVDFELRAGEILGLCGENGAGKSTLVKILGGLVAPTAGQIVVDGTLLKPGKRTDPRLISIVHQELSIIPALSVLDNVLMGDERVKQLYIRSEFEADVRRQLDALALKHVDLYQPAKELSLAEQQLVEIARCVMRGAKILMLDEPTATLSDSEIIRVFEVVRWLRDNGTTVVFISHRLNEVFELTDRISVFRNGQHISTRPTKEFNSDSLVRAMIGRDVHRRTLSEIPEAVGGTPRLQLKRFSIPGKVHPLNLSVQPGQILGLVGQLGSGADLLTEAIAGMRSHSGDLAIDGQTVDIQSPRKALSNRISYVPEDRAGKGVFLDTSVAINSTASILSRLTCLGLMRGKPEANAARALAARFAIDPRRLPSQVSHLSGGNQQKVAMAKAAALDPQLLVLNEPTRGVDIGARAEIYDQLRHMAREGLTIVFFSTDFEEVLELADRVVTVFKGSVVSDRSVVNVSMSSILNDIIHGPVPEVKTA
ncbi:sugar ABC transporter ATP-binding protein [Pseudomonas pudica]|uniref:Sugar ABC transporter ATP-binding protein n=1 Tax=Pseudomonas pudica TaxID=272772 RepID=A0ABS0FUH2_9PSED|nr:sugar ABC transporter ATP-binding protein [Pseudomonas pudica]MBF8644025.1 sugar ABC transporter ATP-binding protein [Pseudomonas pudica]MBF8758608.1 sugar ABC transporter ATP-binding protein [Pseudomonas pudica]